MVLHKVHLTVRYLSSQRVLAHPTFSVVLVPRGQVRPCTVGRTVSVQGRQISSVTSAIRCELVEMSFQSPLQFCAVSWSQNQVFQRHQVTLCHPNWYKRHWTWCDVMSSCTMTIIRYRSMYCACGGVENPRSYGHLGPKQCQLGPNELNNNTVNNVKTNITLENIIRQPLFKTFQNVWIRVILDPQGKLML